MAIDAEIEECERVVAQIRRNIADAQSRRDHLLRRIEGLKRAKREIEGRRDVPGFRMRAFELEKELDAVQREIDASMPELENFRQQLHIEERKCWELRRRRGQDIPTEDDLRKAMNDPRYWRDGDPELARVVREGFKQLYPDE